MALDQRTWIPALLLAALDARGPVIRDLAYAELQSGNDSVRFAIETKLTPLNAQDHGSVAKRVHAADGRIWSAFHGDLDAAKARQAHALGLQVLAWTVNSPREIAQVLDLGVDGIVSDRPDVVRQEMRRRGLALPLATPVQP